MVSITLNTKTRSCITSSDFLGYEGENGANKLVFNFHDEFVDGSAQLNIKRGNDNGYVALVKAGETYELEVKSSLVSQIGEVTFQLQVSKADGTIYKYDTFVMTVKDAIDSDIPLPEDYPTWQEAIATALAEMENINIYATKVDDITTVSVTDKKGVITEVEIHDGKDGKDGKDGIDGISGVDGLDGVSPTFVTEQVEGGAKIIITDVEGTHEVFLENGLDGVNGKDGTNGVSPTVTTAQTTTGATITITDKSGAHTATLLNGKDGKDGADGTMSFEDLTEEQKATLKGDKGESGKDGADGYSPTAKVTTTSTGATITITDKNGTTTANIVNGIDGKDGASGSDGKDGADGLTPYIGTNGNWWIGETDTGVSASGSGGGTGGGSSYKQVELLSAPVSYALNATINKELALLDDVTKYDEIVYNYCLEYKSGEDIYTNTEYRVLVSNIVYNNSNSAINNNEIVIMPIFTSTQRFIHFWFKTPTTIFIQKTASSGTTTDYAIKITSIKAIKY